MSINKYVNDCYSYSRRNGFWDKENVNKDILSLVGEFLSIANRVEKARKPETLEKYKHHGIDDFQNDFIDMKLMLLITEVAEALSMRGFDSRSKEKFAEELADIAIRLFDLAGYCNTNLKKAIDDKMAFNETRPYKHGKSC